MADHPPIGGQSPKALLTGGYMPPNPPTPAPPAKPEGPPRYPHPTKPGEPLRKFRTGLIPTPAYKQAMVPDTPRVANPKSIPPFGYWPLKLSMWGNDVYPDCVSAEEGFNKACWSPELDLTDSDVVEWASEYGYLNGATLTDVLDSMVATGMKTATNVLKDGPYTSVDFTSFTAISEALLSGPIKLAIDHTGLPPEAGNSQGWFALGGTPLEFPNIDHCVSINYAGDAATFYKMLNLPLPTTIPPRFSGVGLFTWSTLGFVDMARLLSMSSEAYVRNPSTIVAPVPAPAPTPPTPPSPGPAPSPWLCTVLNFLADEFANRPLILAAITFLQEHYGCNSGRRRAHRNG